MPPRSRPEPRLPGRGRVGVELALICAVLVATPAAAAERPAVDVRPAPDGRSGEIVGSIDVAAPLAVVWDVVGDCDLAPKMVANLKSCRILERDPAGRWDVREYVSRASLVPSIRNVFRSDYEPMRRVRFSRMAGDLRVFEGEWRLEPRGEGVRVTYQSRIGMPFRVPGWLARAALRHDVPAALLALRRESVARAP